MSTAWPDTGADILFGIGGTPEGVIAAAALKCMGGEIQGRLWPRNDDERQAAIDAGYDLDRVLTTDDLVPGDNCFFAVTGITDGEVLKGVHYDSRGATTQSLVMRSKSGTVRLVNARHRLDKLSVRVRRVRLTLARTSVRRGPYGATAHPELASGGRSAASQAAAAADGAFDAGEEQRRRRRCRRRGSRSSTPSARRCR